MLLTRNGNEVFHNGVKLTIVEQRTKGPNQEVVKIEGLEGSNGQKWLSLRNLVEGENEVETKGREVTRRNKYTLTVEEKALVDEYQSKIDEIVNAAKDRYVSKPNLNLDPSKMSEADRLAKIEEIKKYYGL